MRALCDCPGDSLDAPSHAFRGGNPLGFTNLPDAHLCSTPAGHPEHVSVGRGHFKDAILVAKNFGGIQNLDCAVDHLDHLRPPTFQSADFGKQIPQFGDAINRECRADYNTDFCVFLVLEKKGLI
jgi:hypothetical protein